MRGLVALLFAVPLYGVVGWGWEILPVAALQMLASLDFEM